MDNKNNEVKKAKHALDKADVKGKRMSKSGRNVNRDVVSDKNKSQNFKEANANHQNFENISRNNKKTKNGNVFYQDFDSKNQNANIDYSVNNNVNINNTENISDEELNQYIKNKKKSEKANSKSKRAKKEKKPLTKKQKILRGIIAAILVIIIILGSIFGYKLYKNNGNVGDAFKEIVTDIGKKVVGDQDPIFVLVLGVSEDISVELTDTIMLVGYNPDTNEAFVLSIPRDTFVGSNEAAAGGYDKINALYQKDATKTVEAVEKLTGVNIDYYVTVKNTVLVDLVDTMGGVEFDVPIDMDYDDTSQDLHIHLKAGTQVLNGDQAEQLVRFRHNNNGTSYPSSYGDNDIGRMRTQREFLKVVASKVVSWNNVDKIKEITTAIFNNLDTDIKLSTMIGYIPYAVNINLEDLSMDQLPGTTATLNELSFFKADAEETQELMDSYKEKLGLTEAEKSKYFSTITFGTTKTTTNKSTNTTNKNQTTTKNTTSTKTTTNTTSNTATNKATNTTVVDDDSETKKSTNTTKTNTTSTTTTTKNTTKSDTTEDDSTEGSTTTKTDTTKNTESTEKKTDSTTTTTTDSTKTSTDEE